MANKTYKRSRISKLLMVKDAPTFLVCLYIEIDFFVSCIN